MAKKKEDSEDEMFENAEGSLSVDLSEVEEDGFDVIPKAVYNVVVAEAEYKISQSGGNPMISLQLEVEDGEYKGRKLFTHVVFSPKAMSMAKRTIKRLGLENLLEGPFNPEEVADDFIGARARARVDIDKYEGEDTNRVKQILPAQEGGGFDDA